MVKNIFLCRMLLVLVFSFQVFFVLEGQDVDSLKLKVSIKGVTDSTQKALIAEFVEEYNYDPKNYRISFTFKKDFVFKPKRFFKKYKKAFDLGRDDEIRFVKKVHNDIFYEQYYKGKKISKGLLKVNLKDRAFWGKFIRGLNINKSSIISAEEALVIAVDSTKKLMTWVNRWETQNSNTVTLKINKLRENYVYNVSINPRYKISVNVRTRKIVSFKDNYTASYGVRRVYHTIGCKFKHLYNKEKVDRFSEKHQKRKKYSYKNIDTILKKDTDFNAETFFHKHRKKFKLGEDDEIRFIERFDNKDSRPLKDVLSYRQYYKGLKVENRRHGRKTSTINGRRGGYAFIDLDSDSLFIDLNLVKDLDININPTITIEEALNIAYYSVNIMDNYIYNSNYPVLTKEYSYEIKLKISKTKYPFLVEEVGYDLHYHINLSDGKYYIIINAHNGQIVFFDEDKGNYKTLIKTFASKFTLDKNRHLTTFTFKEDFEFDVDKFFNRYKKVFGLGWNDEMRLVEKTNNDTSFVKRRFSYEQYHKGIKVLNDRYTRNQRYLKTGGYAFVSFNKESKASTVRIKTRKNLKVNVIPTITQEEALSLAYHAIDSLKSKIEKIDSSKVELIIYQAIPSKLIQKKGYDLHYDIDIGDGRYRVIINAHNGQVVLLYKDKHYFAKLRKRFSSKYVYNYLDSTISFSFKEGFKFNTETFFEKYIEAFNLGDDNEIRYVSNKRDEVYFYQYHKGVKIPKARLVGNLKTRKFKGFIVKGFKSNVKPNFSKAEILNIVIDSTKHYINWRSQDTNKVKLIITHRTESNSQDAIWNLCYTINVSKRFTALVNAHTGKVIYIKYKNDDSAILGSQFKHLYSLKNSKPSSINFPKKRRIGIGKFQQSNNVLRDKFVKDYSTYQTYGHDDIRCLLKRDFKFNPKTFFKEYEAAFGLKQYDEVRLVDNNYKNHLIYHQYYKGVRVGGGKVYVQKGYYLKGYLIAGLNLNTIPSISKEEAFKIASCVIQLSNDWNSNKRNKLFIQSSLKINLIIHIPLPRDAKYLSDWNFNLHYDIRLDGYHVRINAHNGEISYFSRPSRR